MEEAQEEKAWSTEVQYTITVDKQTVIEIHPTPILEEDFRDIGGEVEPGDQWKADYYEKTGMEAHYCSVHKATIPISAMRQLIDQDDQDQMVTFRLSTCTQCITCKRSLSTTVISIQEKREQQVIENSVDIDLENQKVMVRLLYLIGPVNSLTKKRRGNYNYGQAKTFYVTQCCKPEDMKAAMRIAHAELVSRNFMIRLKDMSLDNQ